MAEDDIVVEAYYDGVWHDLVANDQVLAEQTVTIVRGDGAESAAPRPASMTARLDNTDDTFRISNPESPLYGKVGRNTPVGVSVGGDVRATTEATSWVAGQTDDFRRSPKRGKAWVDLDSGGLLQRVNNWTRPLRSAFFAANNPLETAVGYWPCEEKRDARTLTAVVPGSLSGTLRGFSFDGNSYPDGSAPVLDLSISASAVASGTFAPHTSGGDDGWQVSWVALHNKIDGAGDYSTILQIRTNDGGYFLIGRGDSNKIRLQVYTATLFADPALLDTSATLPSNSSDRWTLYSIKATRSGSTVTLRLYRMLSSETGFTEVISGTYSGSLDRLGRWQTSTGLDDAPVSFGHLIGVVGQTDDLTSSNRADAFRGHSGELPAYRFARLCDLNGLPYFIRGDVNGSNPMGPQTVQTLAEQFKEIKDTEDGLIFDDIGQAYLLLVMRDWRYNQTPTTIDVTELQSPPAEASDDLGVHNIVTVTNSSGGEATAEDDSSPLGSPPPPTGVGDYPFDVNINIDDVDLLPQYANWWMRRGTVNLPRYPRLTVNMSVLSPEKRAEVNDIDIGEVILLTGFRENPIRMFVVGYTETIPWKSSRKITFTCAPDQQFDVGTWGPSDTEKRYDMRTAVTSVEYGPTATTIQFSIQDDETWSSTSEYDIMIAGERITIPVGAMGARIGSLGNYLQTATGVLRSRNGVRKTLPIFSEAHVVDQGRWAL